MNWWLSSGAGIAMAGVDRAREKMLRDHEELQKMTTAKELIESVVNEALQNGCKRIRINAS